MNEQTESNGKTLPGRWLLFDAGATRDGIEQRFAVRYGPNALDPKTFRVIPTGGGQLAGPIPEQTEARRWQSLQ